MVQFFSSKIPFGKSLTKLWISIVVEYQTRCCSPCNCNAKVVEALGENGQKKPLKTTHARLFLFEGHVVHVL